MKHLKKLLLITISCCIANTLFAQETVNKGDIIIHIHGAGPDYMSKFQVDIYRRSNTIKITYALFDSIRFADSRKDTAFTRISEKYLKRKGDSTERQRLSNAVSNHFEHYSVYDRDSVTITAKQDTAYNNLLQRVANASREDLLQTLRNKDRFMLDGIAMGFIIITDTGKKAVGARSPRADSHPLLYSLLSQTMTIGRIHKIGPFAHRKSIGGY